MYNYTSSDNKQRLVLIVVMVFLVLSIAIAAAIFLVRSDISIGHLLSKKKAVVELVDSDGDGLMDVDEEFYGSDPAIADTDADGYSDYEEVIKDYSPILAAEAIEGEYKTGLIDSIKASGELYDDSRERTFTTPLSGYSLELGPGWQYEGTDTEGDNIFVYLVDDIKRISVTFTKGANGLQVLGLMYPDEIKNSNIDLKSLDVLFDVYCQNMDSDAVKQEVYDINGNDGKRYDGGGQHQCYVARANYVYNGGKIDTNLVVSVYFTGTDSRRELSALAEDLVRSYRDVEFVPSVLNEYSSQGKIATLALCKRLQEPRRRDACYYDLAIRNNDADYCPLIIGNTKREECEKMAPDPVAGCGNGYRSADCLRNVAIVKRDMDLCLGNQDSGARNECIGGIAYVMSDPSLCDNISVTQYDSKTRDDCYSRVAQKVGANGSYICDMMSTDYRRQSCKLTLANNSDILGMCSVLSDTKDMSFRTICYTQFAIKHKDVSMCDNLSAGSKEACVQGYENPSEYVKSLLK